MNLAGPEELRMELAGLGSVQPYASSCYMSMTYILHTHYICVARDGVVVVIKSRPYEVGVLLRIHLSHSLPNLKLRTNSPKAPKRKDKPSATRNTANARTRIDEMPRPL